ncbi:MAG TPA: hypothetical protein PJ991_06740 [Kiritimatiellia bacterium]|nr:hypothetical protein [Kiritimatiellia bacterium]
MNTTARRVKRGNGCLYALLIIIVLLLASILFSMWWLKRNIYASEFKPVELDEKAQLVLDEKLNAVDPTTRSFGSGSLMNVPDVYSEDDGKRKLVFSQKELNAVLAKDPDFARFLQFRLSDDLVTIQILAPMDESLPVVGGKTLRFDMGIQLRMTRDKPDVTIKGVSLGGIPMPSAWWGNIKGVNLAGQFGSDEGFWELFTRGVEKMEVREGQFILHLKE